MVRVKLCIKKRVILTIGRLINQKTSVLRGWSGYLMTFLFVAVSSATVKDWRAEFSRLHACWRRIWPAVTRTAIWHSSPEPGAVLISVCCLRRCRGSLSHYIPKLQTSHPPHEASCRRQHNFKLKTVKQLWKELRDLRKLLYFILFIDNHDIYAIPVTSQIKIWDNYDAS